MAFGTFFSISGQVRYLCSENKSENSGYKFIDIVILEITPCVLYQWIEKKTAYFFDVLFVCLP